MSERFFKTPNGIYRVIETFNAWIEPHYEATLELNIPESGGLRIEKRVTVATTADVLWKVITNLKQSSFLNKFREISGIPKGVPIINSEISEIEAMNIELEDKKGESYVLWNASDQ